MNLLSPRQQAILNRVVDAYIEAAQPIGSHFITKVYTDLYHDSYSSATVRHEMGVLEEMGYLTHPHTSAGRIPTDLGYRYYVDHGLRTEDWASDYFQGMTKDLQESSEIDTLAEKISRWMSEASQEVSLVFLSETGQGRRHFYLQGTSRIVEKPEFQDFKKVRMLLKAFEEKMKLMDWFEGKGHPGGLSVSIGRENEPEAFWDCAVVSTHYYAHGKKGGTLALIGPRRMNYSRNVPLVERMGRLLGSVLDQADEG